MLLLKAWYLTYLFFFLVQLKPAAWHIQCKLIVLSNTKHDFHAFLFSFYMKWIIFISTSLISSFFPVSLGQIILVIQKMQVMYFLSSELHINTQFLAEENVKEELLSVNTILH